ncbi:MAG: hypothetical protein ACQEVQ_10555 [Pseudomonadota bacterium]
MTNMFKKTLIAAALTSMSSAALAVDIQTAAGDDGDGNPNAFSYSAQGVAAIANGELNTNAATVVFVLGASYAENDVIRIKVSGGDIDTAASNPQLAAAAGTGAATTADIGFLSYDGDELIFRVASIPDQLGADNELTLSGLVLDSETVTDSVSVEYSAETNSGLPIDNTGTTAAQVISIDEQFEAAVDTAFDATIDVGSQRLQFDAAPLTQDSLTLELTNNGGELEVTPAEIVHTIYGDFSGLVDDNGDALTAGAFVTAAPAGADADPDTFAGYEFAEDMQSVSFVQTVNTEVAEQAVVTFDVDGGAGAAAEAISTQTFTADVQFTDGADPAEVFAEFEGVDAGEWTLNGAEAYIPYMPYGANISQVLYVTNNGTQTGDITVDIRDEAGELTSNVVVGQAAPGTTKITSDVLAAVEAATGKTLDPQNANGSEKVSLNIVVNAPEDDVEVYSAYNVGGSDRGLVINSSNK